jgi:hypothetical protein
MLGLYIRLYHIIYQAHEQFVSFQDDSSACGPPGSSPAPEILPSAWRLGHPSVSTHIVNKNGTIEVGRHCSGVMNGRAHLKRPSPILKNLAKQMMYYPLAYMLIWTIPTSIRIYQSVKGVPAPFGIATVDKVGSMSNFKSETGTDNATGVYCSSGLC